jgi:ligand-binding SRPBCC domain-containing protein
MPAILFESMVAAPLERVWAFFQNPRESLPALSRPSDEVRIERADDPPVVGARIELTVRGPLGRARWVARIVEHVPPHPVVFGEEARFTDVQEAGPFKSWRHVHEFERIDERTTRVADHIEYRVGYGPLGWLADKLYVARKLREEFRYRHETMRRLLSGEQASSVSR